MFVVRMLSPLLRMITARYVGHATLLSWTLLGMFSNQSSKRLMVPRTVYQVPKWKTRHKPNLWSVGFIHEWSLKK